MSEHNEAVLFANWCDQKNINFWHIQQEIWTPSWNQKRKQTLEGVKKGISDYIVVLPKKRCNVGKSIILFIELKKPMIPLSRKSKRGIKGDLVPQNGSELTNEQINFLALVSDVGNVEGLVAYGGEMAISIVSKYLKQ